VIETITGNDGAVLSDVRSAGDAWLERLRSLKAEFPDVIAEIHGRGLLLGIEFHDLRESGSNLLRFLAAQGDLGYLFSTYLLHAHGIRVTPTLNAKRTIRIEPSVLLSAKEIERVVKAFGALCRILRLRDTFHLVKFIVPELREPDARRRFEIQDHRRDPGSIMQTKAQPKAEDRSQESEDRSRNTEGRKAQAQPQPQPHIQPQPQAQPQPQPQPHIQPQPQPQAQAEGRNQALALSQPQAPDPARLQATDKVAFLGHFIDPSFLAQHEPSLKRLSESQLAEVIERTWEYVDPCLFASRDITSPLGPTVNFNFIGLSVTSEILLRHFLAHDLKTIRQQLVQAVEAGRNAGCRLVGFGQFTSILTRNCQELYVPGIHFTSGNTLTAGMALQALDQEVRRRGWSWPDVKLGIVGAGGNIGSTFARLLADKAGKLLIIGGTASDSRRRIEGTMHTILAEQAAKVLAGQVDSPLAEFLCSSLGQRKLDDLCVKSRAADEMAFGAAVAEALAEGSRHTIPIGIGDISGLPACQAILAATNATEPFIRPEDLASEAVICDVSLPAALTREAIAKPGIEVFKGGIVGLPNHEVLNIGALPLAPGLVYACMAETILLGLERRWEDFSVGRLEKHKILEMLALADKHGFRLARLKQEASF